MAHTFHHGDKQKQRRFGKHWRWMNTPSWWIREMHTVKQRAQTRNLISQVHRGHEDVMFPLAKKPHFYFW